MHFQVRSFFLNWLKLFWTQGHPSSSLSTHHWYVLLLYLHPAWLETPRHRERKNDLNNSSAVNLPSCNSALCSIWYWFNQGAPETFRTQTWSKELKNQKTLDHKLNHRCHVFCCSIMLCLSAFKTLSNAKTYTLSINLIKSLINYMVCILLNACVQTNEWKTWRH